MWDLRENTLCIMYMEKNGFEVPGGGGEWVSGGGGCRGISEKIPGNFLKITGWSGN